MRDKTEASPGILRLRYSREKVKERNSRADAPNSPRLSSKVVHGVVGFQNGEKIRIGVTPTLNLFRDWFGRIEDHTGATGQDKHHRADSEQQIPLS